MICIRTSQTFQSHAASVIDLLNGVDQNNADTLGIFTYVAAKSYGKMLSRWENPEYSAPFFKCLLDISPSRARAEGAGGRLFPDPQSINTSSGKRDADFLKSLSQPLNEHFLKLSKLGIPNLMKLAVEYTTDSDLPPIYTMNTCEEVHRLLCHLLRCYDRSLAALDKFTNKPLSDKEVDDFASAVHCFTTCALMLRDFVYSSFLEEHISRIQPTDPRTVNCQGADGHVGTGAGAGVGTGVGASAGVGPNAHRHVDGRGNEDEGGDGDEAVDPDLRDIQPGTILPNKEPLSVSGSYVEWLRLQVIYFEALTILIGVLHPMDRPLSIMIIAVARPKKDLRDWRDIVTEVMRKAEYTEMAISEASVKLGQLVQHKLRFTGTLHCEAILLSLILAQRSGAESFDVGLQVSDTVSYRASN
jgi:hypothetical protein